MIQFAFINESTVVPDAEIQPAVAAIQKQVSEHFAPLWGVDATLSVFAKGVLPPPNFCLAVILDDSDQAGALAYHETTAAGLPIAKVFAKTSQQDGESWTVSASHEILEALADPEINLTAFLQDSASTGKLYAYECADPVQNATYTIDGIQVSDFVTPAYFESATGTASALAGPYDYLKQLTAPLPAMLPGGYLSVFNVAGDATGWQQITDFRAPPHRMLPPAGSRRHRRMLPRALWRRSQTP